MSMECSFVEIYGNGAVLIVISGICTGKDEIL